MTLYVVYLFDFYILVCMLSFHILSWVEASITIGDVMQLVLWTYRNVSCLQTSGIGNSLYSLGTKIKWSLYGDMGKSSFGMELRGTEVLGRSPGIPSIEWI